MDLLKVRPLTDKDLDEVRVFDDLSGNYIEQWIEDNVDYAWGLFNSDKLLGYCSIGYADDCGSLIENYPGKTCNSLLLSDVFVHPDYRGNGYATLLINDVINKRTENEKELVFLMFKYDKLAYLYEKLGFSHVADNIMVRDERFKSLAKTKDFNQLYEAFTTDTLLDIEETITSYLCSNDIIISDDLDIYHKNGEEVFSDAIRWYEGLLSTNDFINEYSDNLDYLLYMNVRKQNYNEVSELIESGADVNYVFRPNDFGFCPIHIAAYSADEKMLNILLKAGCKVNVLDIDGNTPLDLAKKRHNYNKIVSLLKENGAKCKSDFALKSTLDNQILDASKLAKKSNLDTYVSKETNYRNL